MTYFLYSIWRECIQHNEVFCLCAALTGGRYLTIPEVGNKRTGRGARLVLPLLPPWNDGNLCLSFRHNLAGHHVGMLQVFVKKGKQYSPAVWGRTGGNGWRHTQITLWGTGLESVSCYVWCEISLFHILSSHQNKYLPMKMFCFRFLLFTRSSWRGSVGEAGAARWPWTTSAWRKAPAQRSTTWGDSNTQNSAGWQEGRGIKQEGGATRLNVTLLWPVSTITIHPYTPIIGKRIHIKNAHQRISKILQNVTAIQ